MRPSYFPVRLLARPPLCPPARPEPNPRPPTRTSRPVPAAWNTVFRLYPSHRFWIFSANDVAFPPGQLERFYAKVRAGALDEDAGMLSASVDFGGRRDDDNPRRTSFGLFVWAVFRQGALRAGLYDENFFPGYYEDDDITWRHHAAGLRVWADPSVHVLHGRDEDAGYRTGTALEDASGAFAAEVARSRNQLYYTRKWGANVSDSGSIMRVQRSLASGRGSCGAAAGRAGATAAGRFCSPFDSGRPLHDWRFSELYRACVRDGGAGDCEGLVPDSLE